MPLGIGLLTNLTSLYLQHNSIGEVPYTVSNLTRLEVVYLYDNCISGFPPDLPQYLPLVKDFKGLNQKGEGLFHPKHKALADMATAEMDTIINNKPFIALWQWMKSNRLDRNNTEHLSTKWLTNTFFFSDLALLISV